MNDDALDDDLPAATPADPGKVGLVQPPGFTLRYETYGPLDAADTTPRPATTFDIEFEVQSCLRYQGQSFINRFDANTYLYITRAIDRFHLAASYGGSLEKAFAPVEVDTLVVGFTSDPSFPPEQNRDIVLALQRAGKNASYAELSTNLGHDSFLLESPGLYALVCSLLGRRR